MPSTFTSALGLEKIATGEQDGTWGTTLNANVIDFLDDAIADELSKSVAGASDVTLTAAEALHAQHYYTGVLTGNINVIVPAAEKIFHTSNDTTGAFTLTVKTSAGSGVLIPQSSKSIVICDGTNVLNWLTHLLGAEFFLDADNDTSITADTDDRIDFKLQGTDLFRFDGTASTPVNGLDFIATATGSPTEIKATGDTNSGIDIRPRGTGPLDLLTGAFDENKGADIASVAGITDVGVATGNFLDISGTNAITGLGTVKAGTQRVLQFDAAATLTHNGTSLILPNGANIVAQAGDVAKFVSLGSGNWLCSNYQRANPRLEDAIADLSSGSPTVNDITGLIGAYRISGWITGASLSSTDELKLQLGDTDGIETASYTGGVWDAAATTVDNSSGFNLNEGSAADGTWDISFTLTRLVQSTFTWKLESLAYEKVNNVVAFSVGLKALSKELTQIRLTSLGGSDTFDAGALTIMSEIA